MKILIIVIILLIILYLGTYKEQAFTNGLSYSPVGTYEDDGSPYHMQYLPSKHGKQNSIYPYFTWNGE